MKLRRASERSDRLRTIAPPPFHTRRRPAQIEAEAREQLRLLAVADGSVEAAARVALGNDKVQDAKRTAASPTPATQVPLVTVLEAVRDDRGILATQFGAFLSHIEKAWTRRLEPPPTSSASTLLSLSLTAAANAPPPTRRGGGAVEEVSPLAAPPPTPHQLPPPQAPRLRVGEGEFCRVTRSAMHRAARELVDSLHGRERVVDDADEHNGSGGLNVERGCGGRDGSTASPSTPRRRGGRGRRLHGLGGSDGSSGDDLDDENDNGDAMGGSPQRGWSARLPRHRRVADASPSGGGGGRIVWDETRPMPDDDEIDRLGDDGEDGESGGGSAAAALANDDGAVGANGAPASNVSPHDSAHAALAAAIAAAVTGGGGAAAPSGGGGGALPIVS